MTDKRGIARAKYLFATYGLSLATYQAMLDFNNGGCHICDRPPKTGKNHNVDHDHKTGELRGILCFFCNKYMIGRRRKEHAKLFKRAYEYLTRSNTWGAAPLKTKIKTKKR